MTHNTIITDFDVFFNTTISINILDTLHSYDLFKDTKLNLRNQETKQIISHFIIYHVMKMVDIDQVYRKILIVQPNVLSDNSEILKYVETVEPIKNLIIKTLKGLKQNYPNNILILKDYKDLTNPDTAAYIFNKCNSYINSSKRLLTVFKNDLGLRL